MTLYVYQKIEVDMNDGGGISKAGAQSGWRSTVPSIDRAEDYSRTL